MRHRGPQVVEPSGVATEESPEHALPLDPRDRLIVALDLPAVRDAEAMVERLGDAVSFYKIGYQLAFAGGLAFAES